MKKMMIAVMGVMLTATAAQAEHKLLFTDVLEAKQVEGQALFEYAHGSAKTSSAEGAGKTTANGIESRYSLGVGLGHGVEVTASIPYVFREREKELIGEEGRYKEADGFGDFALEGKYNLLGGEGKPYTVVTGVGVKFDSGKDEVGTGTTDVSPFIAASANLAHHHTPYAIYRATVRNHGEQDTHTVTLGLEKEFSHTVTLDAKIDSNFNTSSKRFSANEDFLFELSSYIQVAHNFYLLPSVGYVVATDVTDREADARLKSADGFRGGLSLYYLF